MLYVFIGYLPLLILFRKKISRTGVITSLISGSLGMVVWKRFLVEPTGISERLTSFVFALAMAILFSYIFPESKFRQTHEHRCTKF